MTLRSIRFSSIKGFNSSQQLELDDVNLIYGTNSAGKSSIFQALLLLRQSATRAFSAEKGDLEFRGDSVDLGGFRTFVHKHDTSEKIHIGLTSDRESFSPLDFFSDGPNALDLSFGFSTSMGSEPTVMAIKLTSSEMQVDFERQDDGRVRLANATSATSIVERYRQIRDAQEPRHKRGMKNVSEGDYAWLRKWLRRQSCSSVGWFPYWHPSILGRGRPGRPVGGAQDSARNQLAESMVFSWYDSVTNFSYETYDLLRSIEYVGPLREFPRRVVTEASGGAGVGVRGERLVLHLGRNPDLVESINGAFETLDIPYTFRVERVEAGPMEDALGDVAVAVLQDKRNGIVVSPADVGFGLSQVLPVVVQLLGSQDKIILIEQPEIHLHPRMQSRIADVISSSAARGNRVLVETHSEHILLRAQRRRRESSGEGPGLAVFFVSTQEGVGSASKLRLDHNGRLIDPWPDDFFDERLDDLLASI